MDLAKLLKEFRDLHNRAKAGTLTSWDRAEYRTARDELARLLISAQHAALLPEQRPRVALRVARSLPVELDLHVDTVRAMTVHVSSGGFGALVGNRPRLGEETRARLYLPGNQPLEAKARVVSTKQQVGLMTTSFQFVNLSVQDTECLGVQG